MGVCASAVACGQKKVHYKFICNGLPLVYFWGSGGRGLKRIVGYLLWFCGDGVVGSYVYHFYGLAVNGS